MINRKTLAGLAAVTLVLFGLSAAIGGHHDVLWIVDDIIWISFLGCALALIVVSVTVLVRWAVRSVRQPSHTS